MAAAWWARLRGLERPRRVALGAAVVLVIGGAALALTAPRPVALAPVATSTDAPVVTLAYVRSLPDAGDPPLTRPVGLALDERYLYVADSGAGVVRRFLTAGPDAGEIGVGTLEVPTYLARDVVAGTLLVTDRGTGSVQLFDDDGGHLGEFRPSTETTTAWQPLGVAADGMGRVAITDTAVTHRVLVTDRSGRVLRIIGTDTRDPAARDSGVTLDFPNSVGFSYDELWVGDSNNRRVLVFGPDGDLRRHARVAGVARGLAFLEPAEGGERFVAVVDALTSEIVLLDAEGAEVARYGGPGATAGLLAYPNDVAYDPETSQLFVADTGNARVQIWQVTHPGETDRAGLAEMARRFTPQQVAGIALAALGVVVGVAALWRRRGR